MNFYSEKNVYEAAKERMKYILKEFPDKMPVISFSGGKDSTVILYLMHEAMIELGDDRKIPLFFLDQEVEAPQTIDYVRQCMNLPWVEPYWVQSHFQEWNSSEGKWFDVWDPNAEWIRPKEPNNPYTDIVPEHINDFGKVLDSFHYALFGEGYVTIGGLHADESPARRLTLLYQEFYKGNTWGSGRKHGITFYPLYDWQVNDIWFYIFSNKIPYCKLYNYYFSRKPLAQCRVSSFIHENSIQGLKEIKEIAPEFYDAALRRVKNINTTVHTYSELVSYVQELPMYFKDWQEYVEYIAIHLTEEEKNANIIIKRYRAEIGRWRERFADNKEALEIAESTVGRLALGCILSEDYGMSKMINGTAALFKYFKSQK